MCKVCKVCKSEKQQNNGENKNEVKTQKQTTKRLSVLRGSALGREVADHPDAEADKDGDAGVAGHDAEGEEERDAGDLLDKREALDPVREAEVREGAARA